MSEKKFLVSFGDQRKLVTADLRSLATLKATVARRFGIEGDLELYGSLSGGQYFNINDDDDVVELGNCSEISSLLVKEMGGYVEKGSVYGAAEGAKVECPSLERSSGIESSPPSYEASQASFVDLPSHQSGQWVGQGQQSGESTGQVQSGESMGQPQQSDQSMGQAQQSGQSMGQPQQSGQWMGQPQQSGQSMGQPQQSYQSMGQAQQSDQSMGQPQQSYQSIGQPRQSYQSMGQAQQEALDRITVHCLNKVKTIVTDRRRFEILRNTVGNRFGLREDFQLQIEQDDGERRDIDTDQDLLDNYEFTRTIWVLPTPKRQIKDQQIVRIDDTDYSLSKAPNSRSTIVENAIQMMKKDMGDIHTIHTNLDLVGDCLRLAYYGVVERRDLQPRIQSMQVDVTRLCQSTDVGIIGCKLKANDILNDLLCSYDFLMEDLEVYALQNFAAIGKKSGEMKEGVSEMIEKFQVMEEQIEIMLDAITTIGITGADKDPNNKKKMEDLKRKVENMKTDVASSSSWCAELHETEQTSKQRMRGALEKAGNVSFFRMFTRGSSIKLAEQQERVAERAREDHIEEMLRLDRLKQEEQAARDALLQFTSQLENLDEVAKKALHAAQSAMKSLNSSMSVLKKFLGMIQEYCESVSNQQFIEQAKNDAKNEGKKYWQSDGFKRGALNFSASWVAIKTICEDFHSGIEKVERNLHYSIRDNPTVEEARKKIASLREDLDRKNKAIKALEG